MASWQPLQWSSKHRQSHQHQNSWRCWKGNPPSRQWQHSSFHREWWQHKQTQHALMMISITRMGFRRLPSNRTNCLFCNDHIGVPALNANVKINRTRQTATTNPFHKLWKPLSDHNPTKTKSSPHKHGIYGKINKESKASRSWEDENYSFRTIIIQYVYLTRANHSLWKSKNSNTGHFSSKEYDGHEQAQTMAPRHCFLKYITKYALFDSMQKVNY